MQIQALAMLAAVVRPQIEVSQECKWRLEQSAEGHVLKVKNAGKSPVLVFPNADAYFSSIEFGERLPVQLALPKIEISTCMPGEEYEAKLLRAGEVISIPFPYATNDRAMSAWNQRPERLVVHNGDIARERLLYNSNLASLRKWPILPEFTVSAPIDPERFMRNIRRAREEIISSLPKSMRTMIKGATTPPPL